MCLGFRSDGGLSGHTDPGSKGSITKSNSLAGVVIFFPLFHASNST